MLIDTLGSSLVERAKVVLPGATWVEKAGTFENAFGLIQAFEQAIPVIEMAKAEGQIGLDLLASAKGEKAKIYDAARLRKEMASRFPTLGVFTSEVRYPVVEASKRESDMAVVEI